MSDSEFKPGDIVRLRSGGPLMTVSPKIGVDPAGAPAILVLWFDGAELQRAYMNPDVLVRCGKPAETA